MTSVIISAHNEAAVIGDCLAALTASTVELDITVVANGCVDDTAAIARRAGVRVVEVDEASKPVALNAGDRVADGFPRIYLDADIIVPADGARLMASAFDGPHPPLAAVPARQLETEGRPLAVRAYVAISSRLPAFQTGLFGRGMIAVSEIGRARFETFPLLVADDLFLDSLFSTSEKRQVSAVEVVVKTPRRTGDLLRRLVRVRRGNTEMRAAGRRGHVDADVRPASRWSWLSDVVLHEPWLAPAAVVYVVITVIAAVKARQDPPPENAWGRDESSRRSASEGEESVNGQ